LKVVLHTLVIILSISLNAQTQKIEILNANNTFANEKKHPDYWRLIGDVSFKHNNAIMYCDSAYHYANEDKMKAFGRIKITQGDSITLTGNDLTYFGAKSKVDVKGDVILIDNHMRLETQRIFYNISSNIASYPSSGKIIDNEKTINSKRGEYHSNVHNFIFKDSVRVIAKGYNILTDNMHYNSNSETSYFFGPSYIISKNKTIYCENGWYNTKTNISQFRKNAYITTENHILKGDSLYYNKNLNYGKAINNVEVIDTLENITVFGDYAEYFELEEVVEITEKPLLQVLLEEDTLFMHATKFISQQKEEKKRVLAYNKVKFFKKNLQGKCDSLSYNFTDSIVEMFNQPILWSDKFQITADSLTLSVKEGKIDHMLLKPNPMIINQKDSLDYNQIKGKKMTAYFIKDRIQRVEVEGNGQSIFIVTDEETNDKIGINYTECTNLDLYFIKNQLDAVNYKVKPLSKTTPYEEIKEKDRYLKGFLWRGTEQPKSKNDIFSE